MRTTCAPRNWISVMFNTGASALKSTPQKKRAEPCKIRRSGCNKREWTTTMCTAILTRRKNAQHIVPSLNSCLCRDMGARSTSNTELISWIHQTTNLMFRLWSKSMWSLRPRVRSKMQSPIDLEGSRGLAVVRKCGVTCFCKTCV